MNDSTPSPHKSYGSNLRPTYFASPKPTNVWTIGGTPLDCPKSAEASLFTSRCHAVMDVTTSNQTAHSNLLKVLSGSPVLSTSLCLFRNLNHEICPELEDKFTFRATGENPLRG
ncbi:MAG: hypothetical protein ACTS4T_00900 [Candidatus Hodgkinia cicadicola]